MPLPIRIQIKHLVSSTWRRAQDYGRFQQYTAIYQLPINIRNLIYLNDLNNERLAFYGNKMSPNRLDLLGLNCNSRHCDRYNYSS